MILAATGLLLIRMGYLVDRRKMYWLISGYNTMSAEKKKNVDVKGLARFLAMNLYFMGFFLIITGLLIHLKYDLAAGLLLFMIFPHTIFLIIGAQKYDANSRNPDGTYKKSVKLVIGFLIIALLGILFLIYLSLIPAAFEFTEDHLDIKGLYGQDIYYSDIKEVWLSEKDPDIVRRTNGSSIGEIRKGRFEIEDKKKALLFLEKEGPPYLFIQDSKNLIIINISEEEKVQKLFIELKKRLNN